MHPSKFFQECNIRSGLDIVEIYDDQLKQLLKAIHPLNFLKTNIQNK